jgi:hypothetical protein
MPHVERVYQGSQPCMGTNLIHRIMEAIIKNLQKQSQKLEIIIDKLYSKWLSTKKESNEYLGCGTAYCKWNQAYESKILLDRLIDKLSKEVY